MHTFFINTSKKSLNDYEVLFDIHYENKSLVSMECPISEWYHEETGYLACVRQMGDLIEGYQELNNAFNLILYIDLPENEVYSSIQRDGYHDKERAECCQAMQILFTHMVNTSLVSALSDSGRKPQNVLIMFGVEKQFADYPTQIQDASTRSNIMGHLFKFLGLPEDSKVKEIVHEVEAGNASDKVQELAAKLEAASAPALVPGLRKQYTGDMQVWCAEVEGGMEVEKANEALFDRISATNKNEEDRIGIEGINCRYDTYASRVNKSIMAVSQLNVALHLLQCVEANSVYQEDGKTLLPFHPYTAAEVAPLFKIKELQYANKAEEVDTLAQLYTDLRLAPTLKEFDFAKFGLDSHGDRAKKLVEVDAAVEEKPAEDPEKEETGEETEGEEESVPASIVKGTHKEMELTAEKGGPLLQLDPFDYNCETGSENLFGMKAAPNEYVEHAKKMRMHHLDYLKNLRRHISKVLSNYAGKSKENKAALLQMGGFPYAKENKETGILEDVENVSRNAYTTAINQYMEFCAGRSIAITDIDEQCNWFVSRIRQIEESLKRIGIVALGMLLAIFAIYLPFLLIQFEAIVADVMTATIAICSVLIPIGLFFLVLLFVKLAQKKKYLKAWMDFLSRSNAALAGNTEAARDYDRLLATVIPTLRWIYEYKLDVEYYAECCNVADAKVEHHRRKLRARANAIRNILADLEYQEPEEGFRYEKPEAGSNAIDYNVPFCTGTTNRPFYTVIDKKFFNPGN